MDASQAILAASPPASTALAAGLEDLDRLVSDFGRPNRAWEALGVALSGHVQCPGSDVREQGLLKDNAVTGTVQLHTVDTLVEAGRKQVTLHGPAEVRSGVLGEPVRGGAERGEAAVIHSGCQGVALDRVVRRHGRLLIEFVEGVGHVTPSRVGVATVTAWAHEVESLRLVCATLVSVVGAHASRNVACARIATVIDRVHLA